MIERRIIYDKDRLQLQLSAAVMKELFDDILKDGAVGLTPETHVKERRRLERTRARI